MNWTSVEPIISEDAALAIIDEFFPSAHSHVPFGRGDDCAEIVTSGQLALSTDFFWQDSHFKTKYFLPEEVGAKALTVAVSDLAAAGAVPLGFSLGLMLPAALGAEQLREIMKGMSSVASEFSMALSGGDLSKGRSLGFCITVWGQSISPDNPVFLKRAQGKQGDLIFMVGETGQALAGRQLLEASGRSAIKTFPELAKAHLAPKALVSEGQTLARLVAGGLEIGAMDLSDGLIRDLPRLLGKHGAELSLSEFPVSPHLEKYANMSGRHSHEMMLVGGEDYALVGTCRTTDWLTILGSLPNAVVLGRVCSTPGVYLMGRPVNLQGFDHFASKESLPCPEKK